MESYVQLKDISFSYGDTAILKNINMDVKKGSFISIIGPNGSGKSTLLKVITLINKPLKGNILLENKDILSLKRKEIAQRLAVVPQNTAMEFDYRVMDVVLMGRYPFVRRLKGEEQNDYDIAIASLKYTNTLHLAERSFMDLSGGEKQRVILAQALTQQPEILILDEPISHLDLQHQVEILNLIKKMCIDNGLTVIAVLHDLNMASTYSDKIIMLKDGEVFCHGEPVEVLNTKNIKEVFNTDVYLSIGVIGHKPYVYTLSKPHIEKKGIRVHVICGGGSGSEILKELYINGFDVSCGILTIGDQDWKTAKECEMDIAEEIPFVEVSEEAYTLNKQLIQNADCVLLAGVYFGKANIKNLEILLDEEFKSKSILVIEDESFASRDYTDGYAEAIYKRLKEKMQCRLIDIKNLKDELVI